METTMKTYLTKFLAIALIAFVTNSIAQSTKPLTLVVPFPPGGATDQLARVVAQKLTEKKGYLIVVENKPGAGSQVAINAIKQTPADGMTLFIGDIGAYSLNRHLYSQLSYDTEVDLQPVTLVGKAPLFLMIPANSPYKSLPDLISAGKIDNISYGSPGVGTGAHVAAEMLRTKTGMKLTHIPYRGAGPALVDLASGQIAFMFDPLASSMPFIKDGRLRALAVASPTRNKLMSELPTVSELGAEGVNFTAWFGIAVKAGTQPAIVRRLNQDISEVISASDVVKRFAEIGIEVSPTTVEAFEKLISNDAKTYGPVIKALNIKLD